MITATGLTKRYGTTTAVDELTFAVKPGIVTGFLGPNGAGKTTTMRLILGLDTATAGTVTVNGHAYREKQAPMQEIGALLDPTAVHGGRSAYHHLLWQAQAGGLPKNRVDDVLDMVGLAEVAGKRVGGFSLGMQQLLGIASALLGDPPVLLFDEPVNGLDPGSTQRTRLLLPAGAVVVGVIPQCSDAPRACQRYRYQYASDPRCRKRCRRSACRSRSNWD